MGDAAAIGGSPANLAGYSFGEMWAGDKKESWVTGLPADLQAKFDKLDSAPPETRAALAEALVNEGLKAFDDAAKGSSLTPDQLTTMRDAVAESLRASAGTVMADSAAAATIKDMSIEDLMFFVMSERTKQLDRQIRSFAEEIQNRNNLMSSANDMLSQARNMYAGLDDDESATMSTEMASFFEKNGIEIPSDSARTDAMTTSTDPQDKVDDAQTALDSIDDMDYADNACIKVDVPDDVMQMAKKYGIDVPNDQDGVAGITQDYIRPLDTYTYEFTVQSNPGLGMYHAHMHGQTAIVNGLFAIFQVGDVPLPLGRTVGNVEIPADLDVTTLQEIPMVLNDAGVIGLSLNGKSFPATQPIAAKKDEWFLIHFFNEGLQGHPMHLHRQPQIVVAKDGFPLDAPYRMDTLWVSPGERYTALVKAEDPGKWAFHCHIVSHAESDEGLFGMVTVLIVE